MTEIDAKTFWRLMGSRPVGVPVVAAQEGDRPAGLLALSATHVSASPPSMLVCVGQSTSALETIRAAGAFAISYLPEGAEDVADTFGGRRGLSGADRFAPGQWTSLKTGAPVFAEAIAAFDCSVTTIFTFEGTDLIIGRIEDYKLAEGGSALVSYGGRYRGLPA